MKLTDWHIHTHNSNDCKGTGMSIETLIRRAKEMGITDFGVSDHCHAHCHYADIADSHAEFKAALEAHPELKEHMHFGMELSVMSEWYVNLLQSDRIIPENATADVLLKGLPDEPGPFDSTPCLVITDELRKKYEIEYVIAGVHWGIYCSGRSEKEIWDQLMRQFFFAVSHPHTDILAHWLWNDTAGLWPNPFNIPFENIPKTVLDDTYHALRIYNTVFEVNSCYCNVNSTKYPPNFCHKYLEYAASLQERGITLSFGSDNHADGYPVHVDGCYKVME